MRASHNGHFHAVRFYESTESLCRIVADFLNEGLSANQPTLVVTTPEHRAGIEEALRALNLDVAALQASRDLLFLDAEETLAAFMVGGTIDTTRFQAKGTEIIQAVCGDRTDRPWRAYGEMVDILWKRGHSGAAVLLEMLWNKASRRGRPPLCGYEMSNARRGNDRGSICGQHTHIVGDDGMLVRAAATLH